MGNNQTRTLFEPWNPNSIDTTAIVVTQPQRQQQVISNSTKVLDPGLDLVLVKNECDFKVDTLKISTLNSRASSNNVETEIKINPQNFRYRETYHNVFLNTTQFMLVHWNDLIMSQDWIHLTGLIENENGNSNSNSNEFVDKNITKSEEELKKGGLGHQLPGGAPPFNNEYFIEWRPIKVKRDFLEDKQIYWIVDGNHRYLRGLLKGFKYFLVEICGAQYTPPRAVALKDKLIILEKHKRNYSGLAETLSLGKLNDKYIQENLRKIFDERIKFVLVTGEEMGDSK